MVHPVPGPRPQGLAPAGLARYHAMPSWVRVIFLSTNLLVVVLFVFHWFAIPVAGIILSGTLYYYLLFALLGFNLFMGLPAKRQQQGKPRWYDYMLGGMLVGCLGFFLLNSHYIAARGWEPPPTLFHLGLAIIVCLVALEAARRIAGWPFLFVILVFGLYPLVADRMPGVLFGFPVSFSAVMGDFAFGANGILGMPAHILGTLILGYFFFAGAMVGFGGGEFFLRLATAILGRYRGGPAKVAVLGTAFMGSLSGQALANIVAVGSFTIPAMKKMGFAPHYAGAIEACASSGGAIMPPIMGGMVFISAMISGVPYSEFVTAAFIPAVLYYFGLLVQVHGYAVNNGFKGLPKSEIPRIGAVVKDGWIFIVALVFLISALVYFRLGNISPIYAVGLLLGLSFIPRKTRPTWHKLEEVLVQTSGLINFMVGILLPMGLILIGLFKTGLAAGFTVWIVNMGAGNLHLLILLGVLVSLVMGMVGLQFAAHLFLAVTLAPALVSIAGIPMTAAHLFIICYAVLGGITPPVAIHSFVAAGIAGASPMKTAWTSCRMGVVLFFVPLFFVLQPALVMHGTPLEILYRFVLALLGIYLVASALEGNVVHIGRPGFADRVAIGLGGFLIAFPETYTTIAGLALALAGFLARMALNRAALARQAS